MAFLDGTGLGYLIGKIKSAFVAKADTQEVVELDIDATPTASSQNLVTSGGVKSYVDGAIPPPELFIGTIGTTTYSEIAAALAAGKFVVVSNSYQRNRLIPLSNASGTLEQNVNCYKFCTISERTSNSFSIVEVRIQDNLINNEYETTYTIEQGDWAESNSDSAAYIKNKPAFSTNIQNDKTSTTKIASPSAVYGEVHPAVGSSQPAGGLLPNVFYALGTLTGSVQIAFASPTDNAIENEYKFGFTAGSTAPTITWPNGISWVGNCLDTSTHLPVVDASTYYEVSVVNGKGVIVKFE